MVGGDGLGLPSGSLALARYTATGTPDGTFGNGGRVANTFDGIYNVCRSVAVEVDGKILLAGLLDIESSSQRSVLARYTDAGDADSGFGSSGKVITEIDGSDYFVSSVAVQGDGKIVVAGNFHNGNNWDLALVRYLVEVGPRFSLSPATQACSEGDAVTFRALATGEPAPTYQWWHDDQPIDGATEPTIEISAATAADAGTYYCVASSGDGSGPSTRATLIVLPRGAPQIVQQPKDVRATNRPASMTVVATGPPPLSYQWYREDGTPVDGATEATLTLPPPSVAALAGRAPRADNPLGGYFVEAEAAGQKVRSLLVQYAARLKPLPMPTVGPSSRSFSDTLTLEMRCAEPTASIYYTTDGSMPDANSAEYDRAFPPVITEKSIVTAIAIQPFSDRLHSPPSIVRHYYKVSPVPVALVGGIDGRTVRTDALSGRVGETPANAVDAYQFTIPSSRVVHISVSEPEGQKSGNLTLEVFNSTGQSVHKSPKPAIPLVWNSSEALPAGTYTVEVRASGDLTRPKRWPYLLTISSGDNWGILPPIDRQVHHVALKRLTGQGGFSDVIARGKRSWVVSHGRVGSERTRTINNDTDITNLAMSLAGTEGAQVLVVDWKTAAADGDPPLLGGAAWIRRTAEWVAGRLDDLDITGSKLSLAGHSWGSYVAHWTGRELAPARLLAVDPAKAGGTSGINFSKAADHSWAFWSSALGHEKNTLSADDSFVVRVPPSMEPEQAHGISVIMVTNLMRQIVNRSHPIASRFAPNRIVAGSWTQNRVRGRPTVDAIVRPARGKDKDYPFEAAVLIDGSANVISIVP